MEAFEGIDELVVTDIYAASEDPIDGVNSQNFVNEFCEKSEVKCVYMPGKISDVAKQLMPELKEGDVVIGLGAGTITGLGKELLALSQVVVR